MSKKLWPENCMWPEPIEDGTFLNVEDYSLSRAHEDADPFIKDLQEIKEFADELVDEGILNQDYELEDEDEYSDYEEDAPLDWDLYFSGESFDFPYWEQSFVERYYKLKFYDTSPAETIETIINYEFTNTNLMRQAFTRRSFALEYGAAGKNENAGSYEELEFIGDRILDFIVTREIANQFTEINNEETSAPFESRYTAGQFTEMKARFVCKEHLASRAELLGLDKFILYGSNDEENDNAKEDIIEAIIGAVAVDSGWNMDILADVVDRLIGLQLDVPGLVVKKNYYDIFNSWHLKRFGEIPEYCVYKSSDPVSVYKCGIQFNVPDNDKGIATTHYIETEATTRSLARGRAAEAAQTYLRNNGLWMELKDSGIVPEFENSINQLQELYQKKYLDEPPVYKIEEHCMGGWYCHCDCDLVIGFGIAESKVKAKKKAAFMTLINLFAGSGITNDEWDEIVRRGMAFE